MTREPGTTLRRGLAAAVALLAVSSVASAAEYPVLDAPPGMTAAGRSSYAQFLMMNLPRAVAIGSNGAYGWYGGAANIADARQRALTSCATKGASDCIVYAEDLQVVRSPTALAQAPGALVQRSSYAIVPDPRYFWRGPTRAAGVYIWGHGTSSRDGRGLEPQPHVRIFNNAGFDVVRFDRDPSSDYADAAAGWLRDSAAMLRQMGYRKVIVGGQSRGGWNALRTLSEPGLVDGVVAVSPASLSGSSLYLERAELQRVVGGANAPQARVVVVQFAGDPYEGDPDQRAQDEKGLTSHVGGLMLIDRPAGFQGHGAGESGTFALRFALCIYRFIVDGAGACPSGTQVSER